jgi:pyruvate kinase
MGRSSAALGREAEHLMKEVRALHAAIVSDAADIVERLQGDAADPSILNLAHYLALRHHDLRSLQRRLMLSGLSSLGRLESRVLPTLDAVAAALAALAGRPAPVAAPDERTFFAGEARLIAAADALFGPAPPNRQTRIMVTLPSNAAWRPDFILELARAGMACACINCAHDGAEAWRAMAGHGGPRASGRRGRRTPAQRAHGHR